MYSPTNCCWLNCIRTKYDRDEQSLVEQSMVGQKGMDSDSFREPIIMVVGRPQKMVHKCQRKREKCEKGRRYQHSLALLHSRNLPIFGARVFDTSCLHFCRAKLNHRMRLSTPPPKKQNCFMAIAQTK
jgi:hypothetical protein